MPRTCSAPERDLDEDAQHLAQSFQADPFSLLQVQVAEAQASGLGHSNQSLLLRQADFEQRMEAVPAGGVVQR
jgi:hypothetical protein